MLALVILTGQSFAAVIQIDMPTLELPCKNAVLVSTDTGDVLYEKSADDEVAIASITKVMTLLLTLEAVEDGKISMTDIVPISAHAYGMGGSQIWLEPGEQFTLDELIKAICVCSANDAAVAVAEYVGGSEDVFAEMMNARAKELGMEHTHFMNACGLDEDGHYSCARDGSSFLAVVLGSASGDERFESAKTMLDYAFSTYEYAKFPTVENAAATVRVSHGASQTTQLSYEVPEGLLMKKGDGEKLTAQCTTKDAVDAPTEAGTVVGTVTLYNGETAICEYPVTVAEAVGKMDFATALKLLLKGIISL